MRNLVGDFQIGQRGMRYAVFAPKLYNFCLSLGFQRGLMMPSRAFCADETQGHAVILLMQHFGTFPFDHGRLGGKVALDRHGAHAHHGEDLIIVQASHVGFEPQSRRFGVYPRLQTHDRALEDNCGKLCGVLRWYQREYDHARRNILFGAVDDRPAVFIDNLLLNPNRHEGLFLRLERLIAKDPSGPLKILSTSQAFAAAPEWAQALPAELWTAGCTPIGDRLTAEMFFFRRAPEEDPEGHDQLETSIASAMPALVTSAHPPLDAARYHTQVEFDRTYRSLEGGSEYLGKNLLFVAGINIDIPLSVDAPFPQIKFVPWAAYYRLRDGASRLIEQDELVEALARQPTANPDRISFDAAIEKMTAAEAVTLPF